MKHLSQYIKNVSYRYVALGALFSVAFLFFLIFEVRIVPRFKIARTGEPTVAHVGTSTNTDPVSGYAAEVLPEEGVVLPVSWGDLGKKMIASGVIDQKAFESIYQNRGGLTPDENTMLVGTLDGPLRITPENSGVLLNLLWAFGLANKNPILEQGPMQDPQYGGAGKFASTGGWSLSVGDSMDHYSMHTFVTLTDEEQALVEKVSKGIYRPCCGNSVYFPDCNHGMAMLGLLELLAAQGVHEADMYRYALSVNAYWFPETYLTIAKYLDSQGLAWSDMSPQEILGYNFSSSAGYQNILSQVEPVSSGKGGGCGV
ncbi:hypothetical protein BK004_00800 [bacterium CG10_46_32]|nr:MAG: hypothetical protein BK004_00800 [bacterium CG10_46_32]PIR56433.1 MAG: hypothetical protein COU73_00810 [Parcubacteria group bacterium CG10_big_fil_rev_8_21_14_0_10_46_32]